MKYTRLHLSTVASFLLFGFANAHGQTPITVYDGKLNGATALHCARVPFDGNTLVLVPNPTELAVGESDFSVSCTFAIQPEDQFGNYTLVMKGGTVLGVGFMLACHQWDSLTDPSVPPGQTVRGVVAQISNEEAGGRNIDLRFATQEIYDGKWHTLTLQRQSGTVSLILDGEVVVTKDATGLGSITNPENLLVGTHRELKDFLVGRVRVVSFETSAP